MSFRLSASTRSRTRAWAASALWMVVIFGFSSLPGAAIPGGAGAWAHFAVYAVLGALLFTSFTHETADPGRAVAFAVLAASFYGVTDEFHQAFVPGRVPDVADWGMDTIGALAGAVFMRAARRQHKCGVTHGLRDARAVSSHTRDVTS